MTIRKTILAFILTFSFLRGYGQTFEDLTGSALKAEQEKRYTDAIDFYHKALKLDQTNYFIFDHISLIYYSLNNVDSSIAYCNMALKQMPNDTTALYQRGHCYLAKKEYNKAADDFVRSFELTGKKNPDACFNIGKSYQGAANYEKAIAYFKQTLTLEPNDKYSFYELGICYASQPKVDKTNALKYYNKAIEADAGYYDPYFNRGLLYAGQYKDMKKAHADLEKSIEIRPKNKLSYLYNGMLYSDEKDFGKAKDMYNKVIEIYPNYGEAYFQRAVAWYGIGILNMVCRDLDKAISLGIIQAADYKKKVCK